MRPDREPDGQFTSMTHWINHATSYIGGMNAACYDAKGRRCRNGGDFRIADEEGAFPVSFWFGEGGESPKQQRASKKAALATMKMNYPWRYK